MVELVKQNFEKNKKLYHEIEAKLRKKLGNDVHIDHVGSTAIPDLYGKNIIDILIGAKDRNEFDQIFDVIVSEGYFPSQKSKTEIYQFFASTQEESKSGDSHIHLVIENTDRYQDFLTLRDYLLEHEEEALAYSDHKKELIRLGVVNRQLYRATKSEYVTQLLERARANKNK